MSVDQSIARFFTDFADEAVIIPGAICVALVLAASGWLRGAAAWSIGVAGTLGLMLVLKLGFTACGHHLGLPIESPSGHTAASGVFYGTLLALSIRRSNGPGWLEPAGAVAVVAAVGLSRLVLHAHSPAEVVVGGVVGLTGATYILATIGQPPEGGKLSILLVPALAVVCLLHGLRMPAEAAIRTVAWDIWPLSACH